MSWRERIEPDLFYEAPFYLAALIAYGGLLTLNPAIRWGSAERALDKVVPVEFVAEIPLPPSVNLAPLPGGDGANAQPHHGPGMYAPRKVKSGAVDPPAKLPPKHKPAAIKARTEKPGATIHKTKSSAKPRPAADMQAAKLEREAQAESKRLRVERDRAVRSAAAAETARRNAAAKALAAQRAVEAKALAAERAAEAKSERDRLEAAARAERERQAAIARDAAERRAQAAREAAELRAAAEAERRRLAAEAAAAKARKRAELSQELAAISDPVKATQASAAPAPRPARLAAARKASAAAALAESADPGDAAGGGGGADQLDAKPSGGGVGQEGGGGVSWSVDGPLGNRRMLQRVSPDSPDWVATRNLDLTVTVRFQVLADGGVKPGAVIEKTSGFPEIDRLALDALRRWRFQPVAAKPGAAEVWGRVTFRFTS